MPREVEEQRTGYGYQEAVHVGAQHRRGGNVLKVRSGHVVGEGERVFRFLVQGVGTAPAAPAAGARVSARSPRRSTSSAGHGRAQTARGGSVVGADEEGQGVEHQGPSTVGGTHMWPELRAKEGLVPVQGMSSS